MSEQSRNPMTLQPVRVTLPGTDQVLVRRDVPVPGADGTMLAMDVYAPPDEVTPAAGVVVMVHGYPDEGFQRVLGCRFKEMASVQSWGRLIAASGMTAVAYTTRSPDADLHALLGHLASHGAALGIDAFRIALWACSGHGPVALSALMHPAPPRVSCASFLYPYLMDVGAGTHVADAARTFRFANAGAGRQVQDVRDDVPILIVRAGGDQMPGLNAALDGFVSAAVADHGRLTLVNHPGPHAFDLTDDSRESEHVIRVVIHFLASHLHENGEATRHTPGGKLHRGGSSQSIL